MYNARDQPKQHPTQYPPELQQQRPLDRAWAPDIGGSGDGVPLDNGGDGGQGTAAAEADRAVDWWPRQFTRSSSSPSPPPPPPGRDVPRWDGAPQTQKRAAAAMRELEREFRVELINRLRTRVLRSGGLLPGEKAVTPATRLFRAALEGNLTAVRGLLGQTPADGVTTRRDARGWSALHAAAARGHREVIAALVAAGADVNLRSAVGATPLHIAAHFGQAKAVRLLCALGANPLAEDNFAYMPFDYAARRRQEAAARALLKLMDLP